MSFESYGWRRLPRGGIESIQWQQLMDVVNQVQLVNECDQWCWDGFKFGIYSVSQARKMIDSIDQQDPSQPTLWCKYAPIKINVFIWRLKLRRLPTKLNLVAKGLELDDGICCVCSNDFEDDLHLFTNCATSMDIWSALAAWFNLDIPTWNSLDGIWNWVDGVPINGKQRMIIRVIILATLWNIWRLRNSIIFKDSKFRKCHVVDSIIVDSFNWLYARYKKSSINWTGWLQNPLNAL
ncbi:uncharacterized protein [Rutidosis leptorrhynchoides]|uniref:uncharacterized protein n=1 Tax=Rutidosis leptorrhynchoides TaxID=125765 RepID=UPI003A9923CB